MASAGNNADAGGAPVSTWVGDQGAAAFDLRSESRDDYAFTREIRK